MGRDGGAKTAAVRAAVEDDGPKAKGKGTQAAGVAPWKFGGRVQFAPWENASQAPEC